MLSIVFFVTIYSNSIISGFGAEAHRIRIRNVLFDQKKYIFVHTIYYCYGLSEKPSLRSANDR